MTFGAMPYLVLNQIKSIADQCPDDGGFAVFAARAWYRRFEPMARWDGRSNCFEERPLAQQQPADLASPFTVRPNPAHTQLYISNTVVSDQPHHFVLYASNGTKVLEKTLSAQFRDTILDVGALPVGLYYYTIYGTNAIPQTGKLAIVH